ncbi:MAG: DNA primase [Candidatus Omnitrophica bacterium]|nr:DNA primase [Candidatus Omnitrophota bacterium]MBU1870267.1 DNA primase [Candidatus Omnitrophota bacterium]
MKGPIPENILEDILGKIDIVEVVSGYLPLKKAGRNFKALCPFHHEKTPSFMVSPDRQIFHCFGCNESGNAFKFLMRYERLEFPEAVELLAKKAGVILPQTSSEDPKVASLSTQLYRINELTALFYESRLNSTEGAKAKDYLLKRGITEETIKTLKIGYAPEKWDALITYLRAKSVPLSLIEKAGLILPKENGGYYDRFRNRVIFPIADIKGRFLGFGARVLDNTLPKYINSPESPIYTKGKNLYGLGSSRDHIRDKDFVVIVEGYLDFLMPFQAGLKNIVASLGTALTQEQARLLKRYTQNIVMIYDGDSAGELAALRSLEIFIEEEMSVKVVSLPQGSDPDTFVRKFGIEKLNEEVSRAVNIFDYKIKVLKTRYSHKEVEGKAKISSHMLETISKFKNAVLKSEYMKRLAEELDIREDALFQEAAKINNQRERFDSVSPLAQRKTLNINPTERMLIKLMLEESELIHRIKDSINPADFIDERASRIVTLMLDFIEQGKKIEASLLIHHLGDEEISKIICESMFLQDDLTEKNREMLANDCIKRLRTEKIKHRKQSLHEQIKDAQDSGDKQKLEGLVQEFHTLIKKGEGT